MWVVTKARAHTSATALSTPADYTFDAQERMAGKPLGGFTFDSAYPHAQASIGGAAYTAAHDTAGNLSVA
jgi:hypothetical protein